MGWESLFGRFATSLRRKGWQVAGHLLRSGKQKVRFVREGVWTWEFWAIIFSAILVLSVFWGLPGLLASQPPSAQSQTYETLIPYEVNSEETALAHVNCKSGGIISVRESGLSCDFRVEQQTGGLYTFDEAFIESARGEVFLISRWGVLTRAPRYCRGRTIVSKRSTFTRRKTGTRFTEQFTCRRRMNRATINLFR